MRDFAEIFALAADHRGGAAAVEAAIAPHLPAPRATVAAQGDDRILAEMTRRVFQAGFNWKVIDAKWPGFEAAFDGFDPQACAHMSEARFDALLKDTRIVRNAAKIRSVIFNARLVVDLAAEHGSAARCFADWPDSDYVGLLELLKQRGDRLSGHAGMYFVRGIGRPSFITSRDVTAALIREGVVTKEPTSKRDLTAVQTAFNAWSAQSGRDLTAISRILALSIGPATA